MEVLVEIPERPFGIRIIKACFDFRDHQFLYAFPKKP